MRIPDGASPKRHPCAFLAVQLQRPKPAEELPDPSADELAEEQAPGGRGIQIGQTLAKKRRED